MGCSNSKDTATESQNKPADKKTVAPKEAATTEAAAPAASENLPQTRDECIEFAMKDLNISKESATKIVDRFNKDGDQDIDKDELKMLIGLVDEAKKVIKPLFEEADANNTGKVTISEATKALKELYPKMNEKPMNKLLKQFDSGDGIVQYGEFIVFYNYLKASDTQLRPSFESADANGTGTVTLTEAAKVLGEAFPKLDERAIKKMLYKYDSGDAIVQYEEFILFHANLKMARISLMKKFDDLDKEGDGQLSRKEIVALISSETGMDEDDCMAIVYEEDESNDGKISKTEFMDLWSNFVC